MTKAERMSEVAKQMGGKRDWQADTFDKAITRCEELLRSPELDDEQRKVLESQIANFRQMREEL